MKRQVYPYDLKESQWQLIKMLPAQYFGRGRPRIDLGQVINAFFSLQKAGQSQENGTGGKHGT